VVLLSPDVAQVFPDDVSVNETLRSLIKVAHQSVGFTKRSSGPGKMGRAKAVWVHGAHEKAERLVR